MKLTAVHRCISSSKIFLSKTYFKKVYVSTIIIARYVYGRVISGFLFPKVCLKKIVDTANMHRVLLNIPFSKLKNIDQCIKLVLLLYDITIESLYAWLLKPYASKIDSRSNHINRYTTFSTPLYGIGTLGPGGAERQLTNICTFSKANLGISPSVLCLSPLNSPNDFFLKTLESASISVYTSHEYNLQSNSGSTRDSLSLFSNNPYRFFLQLLFPYKEISKYACIITHINPSACVLFLDDTNIKYGIAALLAGTPKIIINLRSQPPFNFLFHKHWYKYCYRVLAKYNHVKFVANSISGAKAYEQWIGLPSSFIDVVYNGYPELGDYQLNNNDLRESLGLPNDCFIIGSVFRLSEEKQPYLWLSTAECILSTCTNCYFVIVGTGVLYNDIAQVIHSSPLLRNRVLLVGHKTDVSSFYNLFNLFLFTSRIEGCPNVLIEAQSHSLPVVTTDCGASSEIVEHGTSGFVCKPANAQILASRCLQLLDDTSLLHTFGANAKYIAKSKFSISRTAQAYAKIIK